MSSWDLLVLDLDGTLLGRHGVVSDANAEAIECLKAKGVDVLVATGRCLSESRHLLEPIKYTGQIIGAGGAVLSEFDDGTTLHRHAIDPDLVHRTVQHLHAEGHTALVLKDHDEVGYDYLLVGGDGLHPVSEWWMQSMKISCRWIDRLDDDPHPQHTIRVSGIGEPSILQSTTQRVRSDLGSLLHLQQWGAVTASHVSGSTEVHILECFASGVDKWSMVEVHCQHRHLDPTRVVAIGDGLNDLGMLRGAGLGIAMGNAVEDVVSAADETTDHHHEDGVARAIERILNHPEANDSP